MFSKAGNMFGMTTRSSVRAGQGFAPRVLPSMNTSFGAGTAAATAAATSTPRNLSNMTTSQAVASTSRNTPSSSAFFNPSSSSIQFGRSSATRTPITTNNMEPGDLGGGSRVRSASSTYTNPIYRGFIDIDLGNPSVPINQKMTMRQRMSNMVKKSPGGVTFTNPAFEGFADDVNTTTPSSSSTHQSLRQRLSNIVKQRRSPSEQLVSVMYHLAMN